MSQSGGGHTLVAGCGDGAVRVFDCRVPSRYSAVSTFHEHKDWIVNIAMTASDHQVCNYIVYIERETMRYSIRLYLAIFV